MTTHDLMIALVRGGHIAGLAGNALAVLMVHVMHADADGVSWPAIETISKLTGIRSQQNVCVARNQLVKAGLLKLIARTKTSSRYRIIIPDTPKSGHSENRSVQNPDTPKNGHSENESVRKVDTPEIGHSSFYESDTPENGVLDTPENGHRSRPLKQTKKQTNSAPGFERFWQAYPATSRRSNRAKCVARWIADDLEQRTDEIIAHVEASKRSDEWQRGYEPMTTTYLNQRRYDSPPPAAARATPNRNGHANRIAGLGATQQEDGI